MNPYLRNMFFSILFLLSLPLSFPIAAFEPVLDTEGHRIRVGQKYHIVPSLPGAGGGLTLASRKGHCPYEIVQILNEPTKGLPVTFSSINHKDKVVNLDNDLNIRFINFKHATPCPESKVWKFDANKQQGALFVTVGGLEGNPGPGTIGNWFKIQKEDNKNRRSYKLQYCPSLKLCQSKCRVLCGDIGVVVYKGSRRLAVNESPLSLVFKKVPTS